MLYEASIWVCEEERVMAEELDGAAWARIQKLDCLEDSIMLSFNDRVGFARSTATLEEAQAVIHARLVAVAAGRYSSDVEVTW